MEAIDWSAWTLTERYEFLDRWQFQPWGNLGWILGLEDTKGSPRLTLTNTWARDSRSYDFDSEVDAWDPLMDARSQTFIRPVSHVRTIDELNKEVVLLVGYAMAHEGLEWLRYEGRMLHDPHVHGDVVVTI